MTTPLVAFSYAVTWGSHRLPAQAANAGSARVDVNERGVAWLNAYWETQRGETHQSRVIITTTGSVAAALTGHLSGIDKAAAKELLAAVRDRKSETSEERKMP